MSKDNLKPGQRYTNFNMFKSDEAAWKYFSAKNPIYDDRGKELKRADISKFGILIDLVTSDEMMELTGGEGFLAFFSGIMGDGDNKKRQEWVDEYIAGRNEKWKEQYKLSCEAGLRHEVKKVEDAKGKLVERLK